MCPQQLKELTNEEEGEDEEEDVGGARQRIRFGCMMKLSFPRYAVTTRGAAVVEETFNCTGEKTACWITCLNPDHRS